MGDSLLNVLINLKDHDNENQYVKKKYQKIFSSDTTFREVYNWIIALAVEQHKSRIVKEESESNSLAIFDCTMHPIKKLELITGINDGLTGEESVTLHSLGWFPSARIVVFYADDESGQNKLQSHTDVLHDADLWMSEQNGSSLFKTSNPVTLLGDEWKNSTSDKPTPSQLLTHVTNRHDDENSEYIKRRAQFLSKERNVSKEGSDVKRIDIESRLDEKIRSLEEKSKTNSVSAKVRQMLIKSRAKGDKKLREEDRFYLEVYYIDDTSDIEQTTELVPSYHYFSKMSLVGTILDSLHRASSKESLELLIKVKESSDSGIACYRRLPNTIAIYELENVLKPFESIFVHKYSANDKPSIILSTPSIILDQGPTDGVATIKDRSSAPIESVKEPEYCLHLLQKVEDSQLKDRIDKSIAICLLDNSNKLKKKASTSTSEKVNQLLMKSKAKGDKTVKSGDRFYLEVFLIDESNQNNPTSSLTLQFFDKRISFGRICLISFPAYLGQDTEVLIKLNDLYWKFPETLKLVTAESEGLLKNFDRIVVRKCS